MRAVAEGTVFRCRTTAQSDRLFSSQVELISFMISQRHRSGDQEGAVLIGFDRYICHEFRPFGYYILKLVILACMKATAG